MRQNRRWIRRPTIWINLPKTSRMMQYLLAIFNMWLRHISLVKSTLASPLYILSKFYHFCIRDIRRNRHLEIHSFSVAKFLKISSSPANLTTAIHLILHLVLFQFVSKVHSFQKFIHFKSNTQQTSMHPKLFITRPLATNTSKFQHISSSKTTLASNQTNR